MHTYLRLLILFLPLLGSSLAHADIDVRVGAGAGCNFATVQAAITNALPVNGITNILIARNAAYSAQQLDIDGKNVRLIGGYANCQQSQRDTTRTVLSGAGGGLRSIVNVRGSTGAVAFYTLEFQGGDELTDSTSYGGAVDITEGPHALVYFEDTRFSNNHAGLGGAVSVRNGNSTDPSAVFVWFGPGNTLIGNNARYQGGGIFCRDATVHIKGPNNALFQNSVGDASTPGFGGGLYIDDCRLNVGTYSLVGAISNNTATDSGGGLYAYGSRSLVNLYNIDAALPTRVVGNTASLYGGGIDIEQGARVFAWDTVIEQNVARTGGGGVALYDDGATDNSVLWVSRYFNGDTPHGDPGVYDQAVLCADASRCNVLQDNAARTESGTGVEGGAVRLSVDGDGRCSATIVGGRMTRNSGQSLVKAKSFSDLVGIPAFSLNGALVDGNTVSGYLIDSHESGRIALYSSTIAGNTIGANAVIDPIYVNCDLVGSMYMQADIVWQPGKLLQSAAPNSTQAGCLRYLVVNDDASIAAPDRGLSIVADPQFVNAALGNFALRASSPAIDLAPAIVGTVTYDGEARIVDIPAVVNVFGAQDAGAYETNAPSDIIFANGFE